MSEKLDDFSKVLLATSTINYMASALNSVIRDYEYICGSENKTETLSNDTPKVLKDSLVIKKQVLADCLKQLCDTIENLGNYMDGHDIVCRIDERVYEVPLNILLHDMDETETDYEEEKAA